MRPGTYLLNGQISHPNGTGPRLETTPFTLQAGQRQVRRVPTGADGRTRHHAYRCRRHPCGQHVCLLLQQRAEFQPEWPHQRLRCRLAGSGACRPLRGLCQRAAVALRVAGDGGRGRRCDHRGHAAVRRHWIRDRADASVGRYDCNGHVCLPAIAGVLQRRPAERQWTHHVRERAGWPGLHPDRVCRGELQPARDGAVHPGEPRRGERGGDAAPVRRGHGPEHDRDRRGRREPVPGLHARDGVQRQRLHECVRGLPFRRRPRGRAADDHGLRQQLQLPEALPGATEHRRRGAGEGCRATRGRVGAADGQAGRRDAVLERADRIQARDRRLVLVSRQHQRVGAVHHHERGRGDVHDPYPQLRQHVHAGPARPGHAGVRARRHGALRHHRERVRRYRVGHGDAEGRRHADEWRHRRTARRV